MLTDLQWAFANRVLNATNRSAWLTYICTRYRDGDWPNGFKRSIAIPETTCLLCGEDMLVDHTIVCVNLATLQTTDFDICYIHVACFINTLRDKEFYTHILLNS